MNKKCLQCGKILSENDMLENNKTYCCKKCWIKNSHKGKIIQYRVDIKAIKKIADLYDKKRIIEQQQFIITEIGIYFLIRNSKIVYIGQSKNISSRIERHLKKKIKRFDSYFIIPLYKMKKESRELLEELFIKKFRPEYNRTHNTYGLSYS